MLGQSLSHYRITGLIRRSSVSMVYSAEDTRLGRRVALKILTTPRKNKREDLRSELQKMVTVSDPHIASIYEYGETSAGNPFVVMEYVSGRSVADLLRAGGLPVSWSVEIAKTVAEALNGLHSHGVIHRDVKPSNILVNAVGMVKVIDIDFGARGGDLLHTDEINSLAYFAPERLRGSEDMRSDLFGLGATLYEALTGRQPFTGNTVQEITENLLKSHPLQPSALNPMVPEKLNQIVLRALEKDPAERYQSAAALAQDLDLTILEPMHRSGEKTQETRNVAHPTVRQDESQPPKLYFIFEGERALGDAVEYGAEVDLVFNYAVPPPEALVAFWGERFEKVLHGEAEVSITVIPEGFTFRDGVWLRTAKFSGGVLREPVRFYLQASNMSVDDPGFFVILSLYESVLYQFPISVRLVPRLDAAGPRATSGWSLNLDLFEILSEKEKTLNAVGE